MMLFSAQVLSMIEIKHICNKANLSFLRIVSGCQLLNKNRTVNDIRFSVITHPEGENQAAGKCFFAPPTLT